MVWQYVCEGVVMGFIKKPIKGIIKGIKKVVKGITSFVGDAFGFIIKPFGSFETPDISAESVAQGVKVTKSGTNVGIPVAYGFRRLGGTIVHVETDGNSNQYLYVVYAICEGEIAGVHRIKLDENELLPHPGTSNTYNHQEIITCTTGRYANRVKFQIFNGTEDQSQSTLANESPSWNNGVRKLPGVAYAAFRFEWKNSTQAEIDSNPFGGGVPQITFDVFGKKVFDLTLVTPGSENLPNDYADLSKSYIETNSNRPGTNPANVLLDYMMNPRYGLGIKKEDIHAESFRIAAEKYNQLVDLDNDGNFTEFVLTCNTVLTTESKLIDNVKQLVGGCRGVMPYVSGRFKLKVEDGGNATDITSSTIDVAFDVSNFFIVGPVTLGGESKVSKYNNVFVNYIDPDKEFSSQQVVFSAAGDQAIDDDEELSGEFTFGTLTNPYIAREMARMIYQKSRNQRTLSFTGTQELFNVEPGDIIRMSEEILDLDLRTFRVIDMKLTNAGLLEISAVEHTASHYPHTSGEQIEIPPTVYLPDEYSGRPLQRPVSDPPKGVVPPVPDPEDSAGPTPTPTPPPPYEPIDKPTIDKFYYSERATTRDPTNAFGRNGQRLHGISQEYPSTFPLLDYDLRRSGFTSHGPYDKYFNNTVTVAQDNVRKMSLYKMNSNQSAYTVGIRCLIFVNFPMETSIDKYIVEAYDGTDRVHSSYSTLFGDPQQQLISTPQVERNVPIGASLNPAEDRLYRFDTKSKSGIIVLPLNKSLVFKIRAQKQILGEIQEYRIGGDFTRIGYNDTFEYTLLGQRLKDNGLEGFINYINQTYGFQGGGSQNLGG